MSLHPPASNTVPKEEFHFGISRRNKLILGSCIAFLLGLPAVILIGGVISGERGLLGAGLVVLLVEAPFAAWLWWAGARSSMTVSRNGIRFRNVLAKSLDISWDDIERLSAMPGHEGLIVRRPLDLAGARRLAGSAGMRIGGAPFYLPEEEFAIAAQRWIPLRPFGGWLAQGSLLEAFRQYAPPLFQDYREQRSATASARSRQILVWTSIAMVTIVFCSVAAGMGLSDDPRSAEWMQRLETVLQCVQPAIHVVLALCLTILSVANLSAVIKKVQSRSFGYALLWLAMSAMQALWAQALIGALLD